MLTGATGFIGSHIAESLIRNGISTHLFVRRKNSLMDFLEKKGAKIYLGQPQDMEILARSLQDADTIIHCAAATKAFDEADYRKANVEFTQSILNLMKKEQKFLFISSQAAAGPSTLLDPINEKTEPNPLTFYGKTKLLAEDCVKEWGRKTGNNFAILRPCVVYGPRERDLFALFSLVKKGFLFLHGKGNSKISMIHVEDLVRAVTSMAEQSFTGETYFVSNDEGYSWQEIGRAMKEALNKKKVFEVKLPDFVFFITAVFSEFLSFFTRKPALVNRQKIIEMKQIAWLCSNNKIKEAIQWEPNFSLESGMKQTASWYIKEKWL